MNIYTNPIGLIPTYVAQSIFAPAAFVGATPRSDPSRSDVRVTAESERTPASSNAATRS